MIWYDMIWYDMIWYDMIWYDMIWYDMIWYDMIWYDMIWYDMIIWYDIFNCNWVATRWQLFSTHIHTNNTGNVTKQTIYRTQKYIEQHKKYIEQHNYEECGPCPVFAGFTLAFALQLRKKHGKTSVRVVIHKHTENFIKQFGHTAEIQEVIFITPQNGK